MKVKKTIKGKTFEIDSEKVLETAKNLEPENIRHWYVKIGKKCFPPKQIVATVLDIERLDFQTSDAKDILEKLGFKLERI